MKEAQPLLEKSHCPIYVTPAVFKRQQFCSPMLCLRTVTLMTYRTFLPFEEDEKAEQHKI